MQLSSRLRLSLVYSYAANISISTSISTKNLRVNRCDASISALCLRLCLCLRRAGLHVRRNDASISTSTREWNDFHSLVLVLMLASLPRTCKPGRHKHKHERKERKMKNSDKLSAYNLVTHARSRHLPPCWNQISRQKAARLHDCAKFVCFCACVCHVMLMLITRVNILVLVFILMLASYV